MITALARVVLLCHEIAERRTFWEALGFEQLFEGQTPQGQPLLHLGLPHQADVAIWLLEAESDDQRSRIGRQTGAQPALVLYSDDLDADLSKIEAAGGSVTSRGGDAASSWLHVTDPDGNVIVVTQLS